MTVRIFDVEIPGAPFGWRQRPDDGDAVRHAVVVERLDTINARGRVEMLVGATPLAIGGARRRFLQVDFESIAMTDRVEAFPRIVKPKSEPAVIRN